MKNGRLFGHSRLAGWIGVGLLQVVILFSLLALPVTAEENVFGLPEAHDSDCPGALLLHGGGTLTGPVFRRFIELAGGPKARIVLVPCAGWPRDEYDSHEEYVAELTRRFSAWSALAKDGRIRSFQLLFTEDPEDADDENFVRPLTTATGVWFCGGFQPRLNYRYVGEYPHRTLYQEALAEVVAQGGVVGGTSAGMAAMPEIMTLYQYRQTSNSPATVVAGHGFGLMTGAIVEQHFDGKGGRVERFAGMLRNESLLDELSGRPGTGQRMMGLAVEEKTALVVQGNRLEVVGAGHCHVFAKRNNGRTLVWSKLDAGDRVTVDREADGDALVNYKPEESEETGYSRLVSSDDDADAEEVVTPTTDTTSGEEEA